MAQSELCVCGHPQSSHRTYGCAALRPNPDPKKTYVVLCGCEKFQEKKAPAPMAQNANIDSSMAHAWEGGNHEEAHGSPHTQVNVRD
jgi:hypothetical protein